MLANVQDDLGVSVKRAKRELNLAEDSLTYESMSTNVLSDDLGVPVKRPTNRSNDTADNDKSSASIVPCVVDSAVAQGGTTRRKSKKGKKKKPEKGKVDREAETVTVNVEHEIATSEEVATMPNSTNSSVSIRNTTQLSDTKSIKKRAKKKKKAQSSIQAGGL